MVLTKMIGFLVSALGMAACVASLPLYEDNAHHFGPYSFLGGMHGYGVNFGVPVGTPVTEVRKSSPVLHVRAPSPYGRAVAPSYAARSYRNSPLVAAPSESPYATAYASPYDGVPFTASAFAKEASPLLSASLAKLPPTVGNHGVEYAPAANKPYDPAVHLNEPAKLISPEYHALSGIISTVGQVSLEDKNDPRKHGYASSNY